MVPDLAATRPVAERLSKVPEVAQVRTLDFFVPTDQEQQARRDRKVARDKIEPSFKPDAAQKPPTDEENVASLNEVVTSLNEAAEKHKRAGRATGRKAPRRGFSTSSRRRRRRCASRSTARSCGRSRPRSPT